MRDALKPSLHCDEEPYNIEFCANLGHFTSRCDGQERKAYNSLT